MARNLGNFRRWTSCRRLTSSIELKRKASILICGMKPRWRDLGRFRGRPGLEHRIGGLEKQHITGNVSYDPDNHEFMVRLRAEKVARIANFIPEVEVFGKPEGKLLVVGWGGTYGAITSAVETMQTRGKSVSSVHLRHLNPFPRNLGEVLSRFEKVLVPELNLGPTVLAPAGSLSGGCHRVQQDQRASFQDFRVGSKDGRVGLKFCL